MGRTWTGVGGRLAAATAVTIAACAALAPAGTTRGVEKAFWGVTIAGVQTIEATSTDTRPADPESPPDPCPKTSTASETFTFASVASLSLRFLRFRDVTTTSFFERGGFSSSPPTRPLKGSVTRSNAGRVVCERDPAGKPQDCGTKAFSALPTLLSDFANGRGRKARFNLQDNTNFPDIYRDCPAFAPGYPGLLERRIQDDQFGASFVTTTPYARFFDRRKKRIVLRGDFSQRLLNSRALKPGQTPNATVRIRYTLTFTRQAARK